MGQAHLSCQRQQAAGLAGQEGWASQVSMSQRQQQHRAVQQAVRQVEGPTSSLLWSSTTYTAEGGRGERVRMRCHSPQLYRASAFHTEGGGGS